VRRIFGFLPGTIEEALQRYVTERVTTSGSQKDKKDMTVDA